MRAVQITRFGGPEVLELVDLPDPDAGRRRAALRRLHRRRELRRHPPDREHLPRPAAAAADPGRGVRRHAGRRRHARRRAARRRRLRREGRRARPGSTWPVPDGVSDEQALAVVLQGATAWHLLRTSAHLAGASRSSSRRRRRGRHPRRPAGQALGRRPGHRRRVQRREARAGRGARRRRHRRPALADETRRLHAALREANGGKKVDIVLEMIGGHVFDGVAGGAGAVRPAGRLRHGRPGAAEAGPGAVADGHQPRGHRLLAGPLLQPARRCWTRPWTSCCRWSPTGR